MGLAADAAQAGADELALLFVTVDPARDTPQRLAGFTGFFHPDLVGLRGSDAEPPVPPVPLGSTIVAAMPKWGDRATRSITRLSSICSTGKAGSCGLSPTGPHRRRSLRRWWKR